MLSFFFEPAKRHRKSGQYQISLLHSDRWSFEKLLERSRYLSNRIVTRFLRVLTHQPSSKSVIRVAFSQPGFPNILT